MFVMFLAVPDSPGEASRSDQEGSVSESIRWVSGKSFEEAREVPVWRSREIPKPDLFGYQLLNEKMVSVKEALWLALNDPMGVWNSMIELCGSQKGL